MKTLTSSTRKIRESALQVFSVIVINSDYRLCLLVNRKITFMNLERRHCYERSNARLVTVLLIFLQSISLTSDGMDISAVKQYDANSIAHVRTEFFMISLAVNNERVPLKRRFCCKKKKKTLRFQERQCFYFI